MNIAISSAEANVKVTTSFPGMLSVLRVYELVINKESVL